MPAKRFFMASLPEKNGLLEGKEVHHLRNVLRIEEGERIELFDGQGNLALAEVIRYKKQHCEFLIHSIETRTKNPYRVSLLLGMSKANRLDWALEKLVEIGLDEVLLYPNDSSPRREAAQYDRLKAIMIAACKQSGELFLPKLTLLDRDDLSILHAHQMIFLDPRAPTPLSQALEAIPSLEQILLCIGPESGWSSQEEEWTNNPLLCIRRAHLFTNILRSETAAITALAIVRHCRSLS